MNPADIKNFLNEGLQRMGLILDNQSDVLERLSLYFQELKKWNRKVNLVARTMDDRQILENHFLDSLSLLSLLAPEKEKSETVLDVGTGAGFPGMVFKAACSLIPVVLIEPRKNRYYFLRHLIRTLSLDDVELLNVRMEETEPIYEFSGRKFSFITSRAFTNISRFVSLTAPYLAPGGRIVCMKGPGAEKELADLFQNGTPEMFHVAETRKFQLPFSGAERNFVIIKRSDK
ncbi:16S rRNA (guanine(527)-N(7))-methyltransferase RsmG [Thermodesulfobacteriota bacterium]